MKIDFKPLDIVLYNNTVGIITEGFNECSVRWLTNKGMKAAWWKKCEMDENFEVIGNLANFWWRIWHTHLGVINIWQMKYTIMENKND